MGFLVLLVTGAVLGWLASIIARQDTGYGIALNVAVGAVAAVIGGAVSSSDPLVIGVSATALLIGVALAVVLLTGFNFARLQMAR